MKPPFILVKRIKRFTDKAETTQKEDIRKYNKHLKEPFGDMKVQDIKRSDIKTLLNSIPGKAANTNRLFALLSVLFKHADDLEWIITSPMPVTFGEAETPRDKSLSKQEIRTLWPELGGAAGSIYKLILLTGQRPGQVSGMRWDELDFEDNLWTLSRERTKNKKGVHIVPLSPQVLQIIQRLENDSDYVFPARGKIGYKKWTAHDLRRTASTIMNRLVNNEDLIERVLGHTVGSMKTTYNT